MMNNKKIYYLTKDGLARVQSEFEQLKRLRMEKVKEDENQEELSLIDKRLEDLALILQSYELITPPSRNNREIVALGANVSVKSSTGLTNELKIVGTVEANPIMGAVSNESPVGKALLGRKVGEVVSIHPDGRVTYTIKAINYDDLNTHRVKEA